MSALMKPTAPSRRRDGSAFASGLSESAVADRPRQRTQRLARHDVGRVANPQHRPRRRPPLADRPPLDRRVVRLGAPGHVRRPAPAATPGRAAAPRRPRSPPRSAAPTAAAPAPSPAPPRPSRPPRDVNSPDCTTWMRRPSRTTAVRASSACIGAGRIRSMVSRTTRNSGRTARLDAARQQCRRSPRRAPGRGSTRCARSDWAAAACDRRRRAAAGTARACSSDRPSPPASPHSPRRDAAKPIGRRPRPEPLSRA